MGLRELESTAPYRSWGRRVRCGRVNRGRGRVGCPALTLETIEKSWNIVFCPSRLRVYMNNGLIHLQYDTGWWSP